jgi:amidophosphoribosyltransferase
MKEYSDPDSEKYKQMVEVIRKDLDLTSLVFQGLEDLVEAIGLPKEKLCTHCWDGTGCF